VDAATPVSDDFWEQFVREWGVIKYVGKVYSEFRWAMGIRDLATNLIEYSNYTIEDKDAEDFANIEKAKHYIDKLIPLITWLDEWLHACMEVPVYDGNKLVGIRKIGFYHVRRQNIMPIGFEMRVVLEGFAIPVPNDEYADMRSYALYGKMVKGKRVGGVKNICVKMESMFHYIIKIVGQKKIFFQEETLDIGDEDDRKTSPENIEKEGRELLQEEVQRLRDIGHEEEKE